MCSRVNTFTHYLNNRSQTIPLKGQRPRPHMCITHKQDRMDKQEPCIQGIGPRYLPRGECWHIIIIFLGKETQHVHRARLRRVCWRTSSYFYTSQISRQTWYTPKQRKPDCLKIDWHANLCCAPPRRMLFGEGWGMWAAMVKWGVEGESNHGFYGVAMRCSV
jgi:hypothetical protein